MCMKVLIPCVFAAVSALSLPALSQTSPVKIAQTWATDTVLKTPESVYYDVKRDVLYVSNINKVNDATLDGDGFISKLKPNGSIEKLDWVKGLNDPKGMAVYLNTLYVSDLKQLVEIDIAKGTIIKKHDVAGAQFLNDVAVSAEGDVYVSDSRTNKIHKLSKGFVSLWLDAPDLDKPNGLFVEKDTIYVASMNAGIVRKAPSKTNKLKSWVSGVSSVDGIAADGHGNYFLSNWNGEVFYANAAGEKWSILDTKAQKLSSADIEYADKYRILFVPTFFGNKVVAYRVYFN